MPHPARRLGFEPLEDRLTPAAGDVDITFGDNGRTTVPFDLYTAPPSSFGLPVNVDAANALAVQPDGKIVLAGSAQTGDFYQTSGSYPSNDFAAARLNPDGSPDPTFGTGGKQTVEFGGFDRGNAVAIQPDGKIILAGSVDLDGLFLDGHSPDFGAARLNPDGSPDPTFGAGGKLTVPFDLATQPGTVETENWDEANAVALQPDGKIVLAGYATITGGYRVFAVVRLNPDGSLDPTFGTGGKLTAWYGGATAMVIQPDGKIVLAGTVPDGGGYDFGAVRLNPDGSLDPTFNGGGKSAVTFPDLTGTTVSAHALAVLPDGRLLLAGEAGGGMAAARLNPDGGLDTTFDGDGCLVLPYGAIAPGEPSSAVGVVLQPDGKAVLVGNASRVSATKLNPTTVNTFAAVRVQPDGSLDPTFGSDGKVVLLPPSPVATATSAAALPDGRLVLAGTTEGQNEDFAAVRLFGDPPSVAAVPDQALPAGAAGFTVEFAVGDVYIPAGELAVTATTDNPALLPAGGLALGGAGATRTLTLTPAAGQAGTATVALTVRDTTGQTATTSFRVTVPAPQPVEPGPTPRPALVGGRPDGTALVLTPSGGSYTPGSTITFFPGFTGGVRVAVADVTGDGVPDYVGGAGPGGGPVVAVFDGKTGTQVASFFAFESSFTGGVYVAAADLNGDGKADIVVTPDQGGGPVVAVFDGAKLAAGQAADAAQLMRFLGIDDATFRGGARPALGDVSGDGTPDLLVSAGFLGGPRVALYDGKTIVSSTPQKLVPDFFAFEPTVRNGAFVAAGDVTGDGNADLAFGGGPGGAPRVRLFDGAKLLAAEPFSNLDGAAGSAQVANFFAGDASSRGGVRLAMRDVDGDGTADLITGSGEAEESTVRVYKSGNLLGNASPTPDQQLDPFNSVPPGGVFVG